MRQSRAHLSPVNDRGWTPKTHTVTMSFNAIRDFPDHATFREKGVKLACADKLFLSLTLCNKANFDPLQQVKYDGLEKM